MQTIAMYLTHNQKYTSQKIYFINLFRYVRLEYNYNLHN